MTSLIPLTDKQLHQLSVSIAKAVNPTETPVKEKHVRSAIIGTHQEKSGCIFWTYVLRQPLQENQIVAWKFCHVLHKILREGHPKVISDSQRYRGKLEDIGKLWQHLREGYGPLIQLYTRLLITKLDFHKRNPGVPGNLQVTSEEIAAIGENDINVYFQVTVEMFDYMDDILHLQRAEQKDISKTLVCSSLKQPHSNSMTASGQCRLAPLIPCIQDASQLYDYGVKVLFKLHNALPPDTLAGHRERFSKQFQELKDFYRNVTHMQYFKHLITIPSLPENPPNFLIPAELRSYVTPVVGLSSEEPLDADAAIDSLIDTSDTNSLSGDQLDSSRNGSISPDVLAEREILINHLQQECGRQRQEINRLLIEHQRIVSEMQNRVGKLESDLLIKSNDVVVEQQLNQGFLKQKADMMAKVHENDERYKVLDDKFQKLKDVYSKLREEHINLIRKKADTDKQLGSMKAKCEQSERRALDAERRLDELIQIQDIKSQGIRQSEEQEFEALRKQLDSLKMEKANLITEKDTLDATKSNLEENLHDLSAQKEALNLKVEHLETEIDRQHTEANVQIESLLHELLFNCISEGELMIQHSLSTIDDPAMSDVTCTPQYLTTLDEPTIKSLDALDAAYTAYICEPMKGKMLVRNIINVAHGLSLYLINAASMSSTSSDVTLSEGLLGHCKHLASETMILFNNLKEKSPMTAEKINNIKSQLRKLSEAANTLSDTQVNVEIIGNLVEKELLSMDAAIEDAARKIQNMLEKSRSADSGLKLEVNEQILDSCTQLMKSIRTLVKTSRLLQAEIVNQGKGTASATEFYKRNHQWSEGLISAAKAVGMGAYLLLEAADKVVSGNGKFEQLVVASQGIAASTAQLVVASRVKAHKDSNNLTSLTEASRDVTQKTGTVVATAKNCSQLVEENDDFDISGLSLHQAKRLEMEAQIRILELSQALESERLRLAALRRYHYQVESERK